MRCHARRRAHAGVHVCVRRVPQRSRHRSGDAALEGARHARPLRGDTRGGLFPHARLPSRPRGDGASHNSRKATAAEATAARRGKNTHRPHRLPKRTGCTQGAAAPGPGATTSPSATPGRPSDASAAVEGPPPPSCATPRCSSLSASQRPPAAPIAASISSDSPERPDIAPSAASLTASAPRSGTAVSCGTAQHCLTHRPPLAEVPPRRAARLAWCCTGSRHGRGRLSSSARAHSRREAV